MIKVLFNFGIVILLLAVMVFMAVYANRYNLTDSPGSGNASPGLTQTNLE